MPSTRTFASARQQLIHLNELDSAIYRVAETLAGGRRPVANAALPVVDEAPTVLSPDLSLALARLWAVAALRLCLSSGGDRPGSVLRGPPERRRRAPLRLTADDEETPDGVRLDTSLPNAEVVDGDALGDANADTADEDAALDPQRPFDDRTLLVMGPTLPRLVTQLATEIIPRLQTPSTSRGILPEGLSRPDRQRLKRLVGGSGRQPGDHLALWCCLQNLPRLDLTHLWVEAISQTITRASPLVALAQLDPEVPLRAEECVRGPMLRLLELVGPGLGRAWIDRTQFLIRRATDADTLATGCRAIHKQLTRLLKALDGRCRLDVVDGILIWAAALPSLVPTDTRARLVRLPGITSMAQRDTLIAAVDSLFAVVDVLDATTLPVRHSRYGDERALEGRLLAERWEPFETERPAIAAARQALLGVLAG